jgi:hypothetical protein
MNRTERAIMTTRTWLNVTITTTLAAYCGFLNAAPTSAAMIAEAAGVTSTSLIFHDDFEPGSTAS